MGKSNKNMLRMKRKHENIQLVLLENTSQAVLRALTTIEFRKHVHEMMWPRHSTHGHCVTLAPNSNILLSRQYKQQVDTLYAIGRYPNVECRYITQPRACSGGDWLRNPYSTLNIVRTVGLILISLSAKDAPQPAWAPGNTARGRFQTQTQPC